MSKVRPAVDDPPLPLIPATGRFLDVNDDEKVHELSGNRRSLDLGVIIFEIDIESLPSSRQILSRVPACPSSPPRVTAFFHVSLVFSAVCRPHLRICTYLLTKAGTTMAGPWATAAVAVGVVVGSSALVPSHRRWHTIICSDLDTPYYEPCLL